jgi:hypothetical protein
VIERPQFYVLKFTNAQLVAGYTQNSLALKIDQDSVAPFRLYGIAFYVFDSTGTPQAAADNINVTVKFTRPDGTTFYQRNNIPLQAVQPFDQQAPAGAGGQAASFYSYFASVNPNQLYPPQTTVTFDFADNPAFTSSTVLAVLCGTCIYRDGVVWAPQYPPKYTALPFDGYNVQIAASALPRLNYPLTINPDADFVWQKGAQTDYGAAGASLDVVLSDVGSYFTLASTLSDATSITFAATGKGTPGLPLVVSVVGTAISLQVATDGTGNPTSTGTQMVAALLASSAVTALVSITTGPAVSSIFVQNFGPDNLIASGGAGNGQAKGLGIIIRDTYGKAYMNDYVPIELLFGFDNSQNPGLIYPEIYIPRVQQLYMDVAGLIPGINYPATLTLTFKGMKVYGSGR